MPRSHLRRIFARIASRLVPSRALLVYHPDYAQQVAAAPYDPQRFENILAFLAAEKLLPRGCPLTPRPASVHTLKRVHTAAYLDALLEPGSLLPILGLAVPEAEQDRFLALQRAMVGGTLLATRLALRGCRPVVHLGGGLHHAHAGRGKGFCAFNDIAVAIAQAREAGLSDRILVIDLDLHDGDGTRSLFAHDPSVYTFSIHNHDWDEVIGVASTKIALGDEVGDAAYLAALRERLPGVIQAVRPGLVFYLAGCDPAVDDALGNWRISAAGLLERDRFVLETLHLKLGDVPLVILLAGGYGGEAWRYSARFLAWFLSHGQAIEPPSTDEMVLTRYRFLASRLTPAALTQQAAGNEWGLTEEDILPGSRSARRPTRFLGYYSPYGIELALESYGFLPRLRAMGFSHPRLAFDLENPAGETLRVFADDTRQELLVELRVRRDRRLEGLELLSIEWLLLQNPRAGFGPERPPLPGQSHPGLGMLREVIALLVLACERVGLDGLVFVPAHFHIAAQSNRYVRFLSPAAAERFQAMREALAGLPLMEATHAVEQGCLVDVASGETVAWQPEPMVYPVSAAMQQRLAEQVPPADLPRPHFRLRGATEPSPTVAVPDRG